MRKVHIGKTVYEYRIGKRFVAIRSPDFNRDVLITDLTGIPENTEPNYGEYIENRNGNLIDWNLRISPKMVKDYIIKGLTLL